MLVLRYVRSHERQTGIESKSDLPCLVWPEKSVHLKGSTAWKNQVSNFTFISNLSKVHFPVSLAKSDGIKLHTISWNALSQPPSYRCNAIENSHVMHVTSDGERETVFQRFIWPSSVRISKLFHLADN